MYLLIHCINNYFVMCLIIVEMNVLISELDLTFSKVILYMAVVMSAKHILVYVSILISNK